MISQRLVVDVDGTLAWPVGLWFIPAYPDAASDFQRFASQGYTIIYLSAKGKYLKILKKIWLEKHDFPEGMVFCITTLDPAKDKTKVLRNLQGTYDIEFGFGDKASDMEAYESVGVEKTYKVSGFWWWLLYFEDGNETGWTIW